MINIKPIKLESVMNPTNILFHMESANGWIRTYGPNTASPINATDVFIEDYTGFIDNYNRDCIKSDHDIMGSVTTTGNLFAGCATTKQFTITMWMFLSEKEPDCAFYPVKFGDDTYLYLDSKTLIFRTKHFYSGVTYKDVVPNNKWNHIAITVDNRDHMKSRISIYINGKIISTGYTEYGFNVGTSPNPNTSFGQDFDDIVTSTVTNKWEFVGKELAGSYLLRDFTIYNKSLIENQEEYIVPDRATVSIGLFSLANRTYVGTRNVGSIDPHPLTTAGPQYGLTKYCGGKRLTNTKSAGTLDPIYFYEDHDLYQGGTITKTFSITGWTGNVDMSQGVPMGLVSIWMILRYSHRLLDDLLPLKGSIDMYLNGKLVKRSEEFSYNGEKELFEFDTKITELVYINSPNTLEIVLNGTMYINNQRMWVMHYEGDIDGGLAKCVRWDIWSRMVVPQYWMHYEFPCEITVDNSGNADIIEEYDENGNLVKKKWRITLEIPFPYPQFTEMEWLLIAPDGRFVPEVFYDKIDDYHIRFKNWNPFNIAYDDKFTFTFLHKHGFYAVNKYEQNIYAKTGKKQYQFNSPYDSIVDLQKRVKVFLNCHFLSPEYNLYQFDNDTGMIEFSSLMPLKDNDLITMLCFYTGTKQADGTIARLPMSGYVEFRTPFEDRVWDKDGFAVFMNGKLISRNLITDMSSTIHKINKDIKTRYNLEVLNMAPRISYLTPYLLAAHKRVESKDVVWEFPCKLKVPYDEFYKPRYYIEPDIFNPIEWKPLFPHNLNWYITLIHHGLNKAEKDYQQDLTYTLTFYRNEYKRDPESVMVVGQTRLKGNIEEFYPDSKSNTLIGILPYKLTQIDEDEVLFSIQAKTIVENDMDVSYQEYKDSIDGIMCRLEMKPEKKDKWYRVYYELVCNNYERDTEIEILEWVISSEPNGEGDIWYRKTIPFIPYDTPNFPPMDVMPDYP